MMRQPPTAVPAHIVSAQRAFIHAAMASGWLAPGVGRAQKRQPAGQMIEQTAAGAGHQRQRDDAHGFLRVIGAVAEAHVSRTAQVAVCRRFC